MSFVGKVAVVAIVGGLAYYQLVYKKENPDKGVLDAAGVSNPIEQANKDYVEHKTHAEASFAQKNATVLQDDGAQRAITKNQ